MKGLERGNKIKVYNGSCKMAKEKENEAEEGQEEA
jgi:hypothetical protein